MQKEVKLVGEIVGEQGRKPNPALCEAIGKWPPIRTLKDLQGFLGSDKLCTAARWSELYSDYGSVTSFIAERCCLPSE